MIEKKKGRGRPRVLVVGECGAEGCRGPVVAKGVCRKHYQRAYRYGSIWANKRREGGLAADAPAVKG